MKLTDAFQVLPNPKNTSFVLLIPFQLLAALGSAALFVLDSAIYVLSKTLFTFTLNLNDCVAPTYGDMVFISKWDDTKGSKTTVKKDGVAYNAPIHTQN